MSSGRTRGVEMDGRRRLAIIELEHVDRNIWAHVFGLSSKDRTSVFKRHGSCLTARK